ncbi:MAG: NUDIX hydrolase [Pseudomonadota bacterium]
MNYCPTCGAATIRGIPPGDNRERDLCSACDAIFYDNPKIVAGVLAVFGDRVLLCKRAIEPRRGYWTLPAGFLENGEALADGARRETIEEAAAQVGDLTLYTVFSLPHISQVHMFYRAELVDGEPGRGFDVGEESLDVRLYAETEIPWDALSFPVVTDTLRH